MNVNIKISLTDEERNIMQKRLTGKDTKKMVSRKDVNEFVTGAIAMILEDVVIEEQSAPTPLKGSTFTAKELAEIERLRKLRKDDSYIRGWILTGRQLAKTRPA